MSLSLSLFLWLLTSSLLNDDEEEEENHRDRKSRSGRRHEGPSIRAMRCNMKEVEAPPLLPLILFLEQAVPTILASILLLSIL
jgi:hypothetical protein